MPRYDALFHKVDKAWVITRCKGVYRQSPISHRRGLLFGWDGRSYFSILQLGLTSREGLKVIDLQLPFPARMTVKGQLVMPDHPEAAKPYKGLK